MTDERRVDFRVGLFVLITAVVLAVALFTMGTGQHLFQEPYLLVARFPDVAGLTVGAPVRLGGVTAGTVTRVTFPRDLDERFIEVELAIDHAVQPRIREDSVASIQTVGLLGEKYVELTIGTSAHPMLPPGARVATVPPPNLSAWMQRGEAILDEAGRMVQSLHLLLAALGQSQVFDQLAETLRSVNAIAQRIDQGQGLLKALLDDGQGGQLLKDLSQAAQVLHRLAHQAEREQVVQKASRSLTAVADITKEIRQGDGLAHALLYGSEGKATVAALARTIRALEATVTAVNNGDGLLHALLHKGESTQLLEELSTTIGKLKAILTKLEQGEGTLGALLNDASVYEDVQAILGGAKQSWLLRWGIRQTFKKHSQRDGGKPQE